MDSVRLSQQLQDFLRKEVVAELVVGFDSVARLLEVLGKFRLLRTFCYTARVRHSSGPSCPNDVARWG